jgi:cellulose synthase/poly-beta-1,6-N-acetylglucosamine synthase-like glycosyltransferase
MARLLFWGATAFVLYVYVGYPLLLWCLQAIFGASPHTGPVQPSVSLLVAAYNEAAVIASKIRNSIALDYPAGKLEIVVASDGSNDRTADIVNSFASTQTYPRVRLLDFEENRGKMAVLNDAIPQLRGEIVLFSDASSMLAADSVHILIRHLADPTIGAVSGVYRLLQRDQAKMGPQEDLYWKYETFLKVQEARLGAFTGAHGSLYAIRRELYPFPPSGTINDDFTIPIRILQRRFRVAYEPAAVAYEEAHEMEGFSRRVRITAGNVEQLRELRGLLSPIRPLVLFCLLSHKTGRLLVPLAMLVALVANIVLCRRSPYGWLLSVQALFYGLAAMSLHVNLRPKVLRLPYYFCMINSAMFAWIYQAVRRGRIIPARVELDR